MSQLQGESAGLPRAAGRSRRAGVFSRQLVLGDNLDLDRTEASDDAGVLRLVVPVAKTAKPRRIEIGGRRGHSPPQHPDPGRRGLSTTEA